MSFADLHASAVRDLSTWAAPDAAQATLARRYLDQLAAHPDAVAKSGPPVHLTASCLVIDPAGEHVLLTLHRKARRWFQFGGHLEPQDVTLAAAAEREAREESGLEAPSALTMLPGPVQLDAHDLPVVFGRCRTHLDVRFVAVAARSATPVISAESVDVAWWPADELPSGSEELVPLVAAARQALVG